MDLFHSNSAEDVGWGQGCRRPAVTAYYGWHNMGQAQTREPTGNRAGGAVNKRLKNVHYLHYVIYYPRKAKAEQVLSSVEM
jgi:hypothetical protein